MCHPRGDAVELLKLILCHQPLGSWLTCSHIMVQIITDTYNKIKTDANQDNAIWHIGSIDDGYQCVPASHFS